VAFAPIPKSEITQEHPRYILSLFVVVDFPEQLGPIKKITSPQKQKEFKKKKRQKNNKFFLTLITKSPNFKFQTHNG